MKNWKRNQSNSRKSQNLTEQSSIKSRHTVAGRVSCSFILHHYLYVTHMIEKLQIDFYLLSAYYVPHTFQDASGNQWTKETQRSIPSWDLICPTFNPQKTYQPGFELTETIAFNANADRPLSIATWMAPTIINMRSDSQTGDGQTVTQLLQK